MSDTQAPGYHMPEQEDTTYINAQPGLMSWLMSIDHKRIGLMYLIAVFLTFALGGFLALAVRLELIAPGETIMTAETYNRVFTLHPTSARRPRSPSVGTRRRRSIRYVAR